MDFDGLRQRQNQWIQEFAQAGWLRWDAGPENQRTSWLCRGERDPQRTCLCGLLTLMKARQLAEDAAEVQPGRMFD
ncbi:hypothetical protein T08_1676 [Trichinella sp. T8]|nr:hypothetical protein T08_1676 [Trichinella sp. T8]